MWLTATMQFWSSSWRGLLELCVRLFLTVCPSRPVTKFVNSSLPNLLAGRRRGDYTVVCSDAGRRYQHDCYALKLRGAAVSRSMSRKATASTTL